MTRKTGKRKSKRFVPYQYPPREQMRGAWQNWPSNWTDHTRAEVAARETVSASTEPTGHIFTERCRPAYSRRSEGPS